MDSTGLILAALPAVVLGGYIYRKDTIEKEPKKLLVVLFLCGLLAAVTTLFLTELSKSLFPIFGKNVLALDGLSLFVYVFFGIALIEEFSKWMYTYLVCWNHKEFDYTYDAIVYSVFVSLGFATIENFLYVLVGGKKIAFLRMFSAVPAHAFFGVAMGYYLGLAKLCKSHNYHDKRKMYLLLSLLVPVICHFIYDYLVFINQNILFYIYVVILYIYAYKKVKRLSKVTRKIVNNEGEIYGKFGNNQE